MEDGLVQQAGFSQAYQRRNGQFFITGITLKTINRIAQFLAEGANVVFDFRAFRAMRIVKTVHTPTMNQVFINPVEHDVSHLRIADQMVAIVAVFIELMEIHIIQAGAAIKDAVINDKSFKMKNAKRFTGIHRYAIHRDINTRIFLGRAAIPVSIGIRGSRTNTATLSTVPVNQHANIQFRTLTFRFIERVQDRTPTFILFKIERHNANTSRSAGNLFKKRLPEMSGSIKELYIIN